MSNLLKNKIVTADGVTVTGHAEEPYSEELALLMQNVNVTENLSQNEMFIFGAFDYYIVFDDEDNATVKTIDFEHGQAPTLTDDLTFTLKAINYALQLFQKLNVKPLIVNYNDLVAQDDLTDDSEFVVGHSVINNDTNLFVLLSTSTDEEIISKQTEPLIEYVKRDFRWLGLFSICDSVVIHFKNGGFEIIGTDKSTLNTVHELMSDSFDIKE